MTGPTRVVEVFADLGCPFTHVGLRRFVELRATSGRHDVVLRVRAWPLELVNGEPLSPTLIEEEVEEIRAAVAPDLFTDFAASSFPSTSLPGLALAAAAYRTSLEVGEAVSLELRRLLFEEGTDVSDPAVLDRVAAQHGVERTADDLDAVCADHAEGAERGVVGSPHFFTPNGAWFCPALDVSRDPQGHLRIAMDLEGFDAFVTACFA